MAKFSEDHTEYKNRAGLKVAAYLRKQNIEVTDDQIDYAIENGSLFQLTRNITMGTEQKKSLFDDVKNRATDIMIIEKQIQEVAELFEDLHSMIQHQGEISVHFFESFVRGEFVELCLMLHSSEQK